MKKFNTKEIGQCERLWSYRWNDHLIAKNRIVVPPMASQTASELGFVTEKTIDHYRRLSKSSAGLIFVEYSYVHQSGKGERHQLGVDDDSKIAGLRVIAKLIKESGALAGMQIAHVGGKSTQALTMGSLMAPSAVMVPVQGWTPDMPRAMDETDLRMWKDWFFVAAQRVAAAGFDFVELHAAHGYGLNQWLSPLTNQRTDHYGQNIIGRSRILFEIVKQIKKEIPDLAISVRLPAQDHLNNGLNMSEMSWVVLQLEMLGVSLINVSSGLGGWKRQNQQNNQGYLVEDAALLKQKLRVPVIGVGGIHTGEFVDQILRKEKVDFAAVGRAILNDPELWGNMNLRSCLN